MPKQSALAERLEALAITVEEVAAVCRVEVEDVERWVKAEALGGEAAVSLRWLADDADALRRVGQLRRTQTRSMGGDGAAHAGVSVPYGTGDIGKATGGLS